MTFSLTIIFTTLLVAALLWVLRENKKLRKQFKDASASLRVSEANCIMVKQEAAAKEKEMVAEVAAAKKTLQEEADKVFVAAEEAAEKAIGDAIENIHAEQAVPVACPCHKANIQKVDVNLARETQTYKCNNCGRDCGLHVKLLTTVIPSNGDIVPLVGQYNSVADNVTPSEVR